MKTFLPRFQLVAALRAKGTPEREIRKAVKAAFAAGTFSAPTRPGGDLHAVAAQRRDDRRGEGIAAPFQPHLMFYAPNLTSRDLGSDGAPTSPLFVVDEKTPHALMIVPVSTAGAGHAHATK